MTLKEWVLPCTSFREHAIADGRRFERSNGFRLPGNQQPRKGLAPRAPADSGRYFRPDALRIEGNR